MTTPRRWLVITGIIFISVLLAFPMREATHQLIVVPLAYVLWVLKLLYFALGQAAWWVAVVVIAAVILAFSLVPEIKPAHKTPTPLRPERGRVETLTVELQKSEKGMYFKWLVANRLGKLAYQMLVLSEHGKPRSVFEPLNADGWTPEPEVQTYLEKGLHGSFADFPTSSWDYFSPPQKTPLDQDVHTVVDFLESQQGDRRI